MGNPDEVRYIRVCLLVLNVCPIILRKVIENYYIRLGSISFQQFLDLDTNKHDLYHLLSRTCCCKFKQNRTSLNRSQWDLFYMKNTASCSKGYQSVCPCQFDAKTGITTKVMDVTLCCLFLSNVCSGNNMSHVQTIRDVRNKLIHNESANLDEMQFYDNWNRVKTALIDLASHVSLALHKETLAMVQQLDAQVMDIDDLSQELRRLLVDGKTFKDLEKIFKEKIDGIEENQDKTSEILNDMVGKIQQIEKNLSQRNVITERQQSDLGKAPSIAKFKQRLVEINEDMTKIIPISPLQERGEKELPLEELYSSVVVCEDSKYAVKERKIKTRYCFKVLKTIGLWLGLVLVAGFLVELAVVLKLVLLMWLGSLFGEVLGLDEDLGVWFGLWIWVGLMLGVLLGVGVGLIVVLGLGVDVKVELGVVLMLGAGIGVFVGLGLGLGSELGLGLGSALGFGLGSGLGPGLGLGLGLVIPCDYINMLLNGFVGEQIPAQQEICPEDIFKIDRKITRNVYLLGDAARGKTTYSLWLTKQWCNALQKSCRGKKNLNVLEQTMNMFDFVFLLQLRHIDSNMTSAVDMICFDLFERETNYHATIRHVLSSEKYRSLIIMDGLDEWNQSKKTRKRLPNVQKTSSTVTCFFSMRPWVLSQISENIKINDRVIEILGLSEAGMKEVIANVLINHYELKKGSSRYDETYKRIRRYSNENNLKSFMQIPLLAVVCVQIWYEGKDVRDSMTSFYTAMVNMLIERAHLKHDTHLLTQSKNSHLPKVLYAKKNIKHYIDVLIKLGKVAYEGMLSKQVKIIFQKESLENEIGDIELQFALDTGLISQTEAPSILTRNVSVHFFHQSIQELLAAVYIVTQKDAIVSFCTHLSNVKVILELSNIIMFVCGMSPVLGNVLSKQISRVADKDIGISMYRESPLEHVGAVKELYELQISCYREFQYEQIDNKVNFYVSDIYLEFNSGIESVNTTRKILKDRNCNVKSLFFNIVLIDEHIGITNRELDEFLSNRYNTRSLEMVCIVSDGFRCLQHICIPSLKTLHLSGVLMINPCFGFSPSLLMDLKMFNKTLLSFIMGSVGLRLSPRMVNIEIIRLDGVTMKEANWRDFILSLSNLHHEFDVELAKTNIDDDSMTLIKSSCSFNIIQDTTFFRNVLRFRKIQK